MWLAEQHSIDQGKIIESIDRSVADLEELSPLNDEDYALCLETFEANSDQRLALLDWLEAKVVSKMTQRSNSILSVGCGTGAFDEQPVRNKVRAWPKRYHKIQVMDANLEVYSKIDFALRTDRAAPQSSLLWRRDWDREDHIERTMTH